MGRHGLVALFLIVGGAGCERPAAPAKPPSPAHLERPSKETELATVVLTPEAEKRLAIPEHLGTVERGRVRATRTLPGDVLASPGGTSFVVAPFAGTIAVATSDGPPLPGARVTAGQPILALVPILGPSERVQLLASLAEAEGQVARARVQTDAAAVAHRRIEQLFADRALALRSVEESRATLDTARATLAAALARRDAIASTTASLARERDGEATPLASPISGVLSELRAAPGETVAAGTGVAHVVSLAPLLLRVPVPAGDLEAVDAGAGARIEPLWGRAQARTRVARSIPAPPIASRSAGCVDLWFQLANDDFVFVPGERVAVVLSLRGDEESLVLPWGAVLQDALGGTWVYEAKGPGTFVRRRVSVQRVEGGSAVVARGSGVAVGAKVVTEGAAELFGTEFGVGK